MMPFVARGEIVALIHGGEVHVTDWRFRVAGNVAVLNARRSRTAGVVAAQS